MISVNAFRAKIQVVLDNGETFVVGILASPEEPVPLATAAVEIGESVTRALKKFAAKYNDKAYETMTRARLVAYLRRKQRGD